jgi:GT2 family glycosyltransferase
MKDFHHASTKAVDWVMGSAMFVRGKALTEVGTFDEAYFMYFEDCDWCRRFWKKGWPVYYVHDVSLSHVHRRQSARVAGKPVGLRAIFSNKLTRIHIKSWLTYFWKWRKDPLYKYR